MPIARVGRTQAMTVATDEATICMTDPAYVVGTSYPELSGRPRPMKGGWN